MDYSIKIDEFEGPLDLLLHLIKESNIDIYNINLEEITKQYLDYIKAMEKLNIDIASSYLVMASELIELKSKSLLNNNDEEEDEEENTKENLIRKLIEYKAYKDITEKFKELEINRKDYIIKSPENISNYLEDDTKIKNSDIGINELMEAFMSFLERSKMNKPLNTTVTSKEYSITKRTYDIMNLLKIKKKINFKELFDIPTKEYLVVTFLSVLEMVKDNKVIIKQDRNFDEITLEIRGVE